MPQDYTDICRVALFKNKDKQEGSNQPDYTGPGEKPDGSKIRAAAWLKTDKNGQTFLSVNVQEQSQQSAPQQHQGGGASQPDDDVPFDHGAFEL